MQVKRIVVIGGGTGTYTVLKGLRDIVGVELTAIVTMADDGGSNKVLRDEFGMLPTSGVRQCMVAMAENSGLLRELFAYRYYQGVGISGMTFGNLFMAASADILGSERKAIKETAAMLGVKGAILPVSYEKVSLLATFEDGSEILGEHLIDEAGKQMGNRRIASLRTIPRAKIDVEAKRAIAEADMIVIGPGDLYTNTVANLVVEGVVSAIVRSKAKVVFVMNIMNKLGESPDFVASDYLLTLGKYLPLNRLDAVVLNTDLKTPPRVLAQYQREGASPVVDDLTRWGGLNESCQIVREKLLSHRKITKARGDKLSRSMARHDPKRLANVLLTLLKR